MAFALFVVQQAWRGSGGNCQCRAEAHPHGAVRCASQLVWGSRGKDMDDGWEAGHKKTSGADSLSNCEIQCLTCHQAAR